MLSGSPKGNLANKIIPVGATNNYNNEQKSRNNPIASHFDSRHSLT